jgi:signal transduction histidine kinase
MSEFLLSAAAFLTGVVVAARLFRERRHTSLDFGAAENPPLAGVTVNNPRPSLAETPASNDPAPHLISLIAESIREPLRHLRRSDGHSAEAVERLERIVWQARMLVSRPRPMQAKPTSPVSLLQEAAEEVPLLRDGVVTASWSLLNRQPIEIDPERTRGAFRELLAAGAEAADVGGRIGIKILPGRDAGYPVQIEVEIGRRGTETDSLSTSSPSPRARGSRRLRLPRTSRTS